MLQINITNKAREIISEILQNEEGKFLRLIYNGTGWKGLKLDLALDELKDGDVKLNIGGINVILNKKEKLYFHTCVIDYIDTFQENTLKITPGFQLKI